MCVCVHLRGCEGVGVCDLFPITSVSVSIGTNAFHNIAFIHSHAFLCYHLYLYCFHMDLRKAGSTRVDEPGLNPGLVLPFDMGANHCVRVASYSAKRWRF